MPLVEKKDIFRFFEDWLMPQVLVSDAPKVLNVQHSFKSYVEQLSGNTSYSADEIAEQMIREVLRLLELRLEKWESMAVPRPIGASIQSGYAVYITWKHQSYSDLTGYPTIPNEFCEFLKLIDGCDPKSFVLLSAAYLAAIGANPIYITDQTRDCGIDCIGRVSSGPLHSMAIFVQAKTSSGWLSSSAVSEEYGKYLCLVHAEKYTDYRKALRLDEHPDGSLPAYVITCNSEFKDAAIDFAKKVGFLLRPRSQMAWFLTTVFDYEKLVNWINASNTQASLERNVAPELKRCFHN